MSDSFQIYYWINRKRSFFYAERSLSSCKRKCGPFPSAIWYFWPSAQRYCCDHPARDLSMMRRKHHNLRSQTSIDEMTRRSSPDRIRPSSDTFIHLHFVWRLFSRWLYLLATAAVIMKVDDVPVWYQRNSLFLIFPLITCHVFSQPNGFAHKPIHKYCRCYEIPVCFNSPEARISHSAPSNYDVFFRRDHPSALGYCVTPSNCGRVYPRRI
jgi:hypothetical protein